MSNRRGSMKGGGRWLLLNGNSDDVLQQQLHGQMSGLRVVHGVLDEYPDRPAGYDCIRLNMDRGFLRWCRWYLQDLSRQLKPGGVLVLEGFPYTDLMDSGPASRTKWLIRRSAWKFAAFFRLTRLQKRLLPISLYTVAKAENLKCMESGEISTLPYTCRDGICFRKSKELPDSVQEWFSDAGMLERQFRHHFGDWRGDGDSTANRPAIAMLSVEKLLAGQTQPNVIVLSPHPDDELIGCGGTLLKLAENGARIHVVQMTEGVSCLALSEADESVRRRIRWQEADAVAKRFGFTGHYWETGVSGNLEATEEICERMRMLLNDLKPALVLIPAATDQHSEHHLAHQIFQRARNGLAGDTRVLEYPVWGFLSEVSFAVDVTARYPEVLDALFLYKTAMKAEDYVTRCRVLAAHHGNRLLGKSDRAVEVFRDAHFTMKEPFFAN